MPVIDLRSDTITHPTAEMRSLIASAPVGDDVFGEDPSINELEKQAAKLLGKAAALFVPSGTMGNLIALLAHTKPGDEVILESQSHIYYYEVGGVSRIAGLIPRLIHTKDGVISEEQLTRVVRPENIHFPPTSLLCLENTHNRLGGKVLDQAKVEALANLARHEYGLKLHLDGARLFNAAAASKRDAKVLAAPFDSVMCCLSKGLASPVGSVLVGDREFITKARKFRKMLGGGMRQAGVLAAAGLESLNVMTKRLTEDHHNAQRLAYGLAGLPGIELVSPVETNLVMLKVPNGAKQLIDFWEEHGVRALATGEQTIRLVTHYQISSADVEKVIEITTTR